MKLETAAMIFNWSIKIIAIAYLIDVSFRLMSTRSTIENLAGFVLLITLVLATILLTTKKVK
jgi:hypothetical protein